MSEYINVNINPADYIEVWEVEDEERGKQLVMAVDDLKYLPPADVKPVVRGVWVFHDCGEATCHICKVRQKDIWDYDGQQNFCGNCGADMRGGDAE